LTKPSGIIELASMVSTAPAANACTLCPSLLGSALVIA
jgi:hypothetical protein